SPSATPFASLVADISATAPLAGKPATRPQISPSATPFASLVAEMGFQKETGVSSTPKTAKKKPTSQKDSGPVGPLGDPARPNQIVAPVPAPSPVAVAFLQKAARSITTADPKDGKFSQAGDGAEQVERTGASLSRGSIAANVAPESIDTLTALAGGATEPKRSVPTLPTDPTLPTGTPEMKPEMKVDATSTTDHATQETGLVDNKAVPPAAAGAELPPLPSGSVRGRAPHQSMENKPGSARNVSQSRTLQKPSTDTLATKEPGTVEAPQGPEATVSTGRKRAVDDDAQALKTPVHDAAPAAAAADDAQQSQNTKPAPTRVEVGSTATAATDAAASTTARVPVSAADATTADKPLADAKEPVTAVTAAVHAADVVQPLEAREKTFPQHGAEFSRDVFTSSDRLSTTTPAERMVNTAHMINTLQRSELSVGIRTEGLGSVEVHAAMQGNRLGASIVADHTDVQHALGSQMSNLEHALRRHDLELEQLSLNSRSGGDVLDPGSGGQQSEGEEHRFRPSLPATPSAAMRRASDEEFDTNPQSRAGLSLHA
ncbi:MAG: flagellar hook-length control protein FliK, partial [Acidobacteriia bacterium]|nr:flagellar hook-length control protein FliK [Terriglobia bacterium]